MGRFDPRWRDEHKEAIIGAVLDPPHHSVRHALRLASQGALAPPPFDMPYSTARSVLKQEKDRREVHSQRLSEHGDQDQAISDYDRRALVLIDTWLRKLERSKEPKAAELTRLLGAVDKLRTPKPHQPAPKHEGTPKTPEGEYSPAVATMLDDMKREQTGGRQAIDPAPSQAIGPDPQAIDPAHEPKPRRMAEHPGSARIHYSLDARDDEDEPDREALRAQLTA